MDVAFTGAVPVPSSERYSKEPTASRNLVGLCSKSLIGRHHVQMSHRAQIIDPQPTLRDKVEPLLCLGTPRTRGRRFEHGVAVDPSTAVSAIRGPRRWHSRLWRGWL